MFELTVRQKIAVLILLIFLALGGFLLFINGNRQFTPVNLTPDPEEKIYAHVCGAVEEPGVYAVKPGTRKFDAVELAGGPLSNADLTRINLAEFVEDGEQIYLPKKGEVLPEAEAKTKRTSSKRTSSKRTTNPKTTSTPKIKTTPTIPGPYNLNTATLEQLETVPGIGPSLASKIIQYRREHGLFQNYEDLQKVSGVGPSKLEKFRPYLYVP